MSPTPPTRVFEPSGFTKRGVGDPQPARLVIVPQAGAATSLASQPDAAAKFAPTAPPSTAAPHSPATRPADDAPFDLTSIAPQSLAARALARLADASVMRTLVAAALLASSVACAIVAFDIADRGAHRDAFAVTLRFRPRPRVVVPAPPAPPPSAPVARARRRALARRDAAPSPGASPFNPRAMPAGTMPGLGAMPRERIPACPVR